MGQYYKPVILAENKKTVLKWVYSHDIKSTYKRDDGTTFTCGSGLKLMEHSWLKNPFVKSFESLIYRNPQIVCWAGDYAANCNGRKTNLYERCTDATKVIPEKEMSIKDARYVINHTTREFVDKNKIPKDPDGWRIHPLPLLTCEGNGGGGGDYRGADYNGVIGTWARHLISVDSEKPQGYEEIPFKLRER